MRGEPKKSKHLWGLSRERYFRVLKRKNWEVQIFRGSLMIVATLLGFLFIVTSALGRRETIPRRPGL